VNEIITIIAIALGGFLFSLFRRKKQSQQSVEAPPQNKVFDVAKKNIEEALNQDVDKINEARESDDAAGALADLGNARKRR
jgi:hypothetical protein